MCYAYYKEKIVMIEAADEVPDMLDTKQGHQDKKDM